MRRSLVLLAALVLTLPAAAQDAGRFEFGLFGGASIGSRISLTPGSDVRIGDAGAYGLRGAYDVSRHFGLEASWSHAKATATTRDPSTSNIFRETDVKIDTVTLSALYNYGHGRVRGFFGLGAGVMILDPVLAASTGSSSRFTTSLTAGGKFFVTPSLAFRLDGTYRFRTTDNRVSTLVCLDGCKTYTTNYYSNAELTAGVSIRLGDEPFTDAVSSPTESQRRFWAAAGGVAFFDLVPWAFNRYVTKAEFAYISMDTFRANATPSRRTSPRTRSTAASSSTRRARTATGSGSRESSPRRAASSGSTGSKRSPRPSTTSSTRRSAACRGARPSTASRRCCATTRPRARAKAGTT